MPIIEVDHVSKEYRLGAMQNLRQTLLNVASRLTGKHVAERPLFKALDDINFRIEPGEVVGIIGHNGAGKSTLLKMLARISTPTIGSVSIHGRVAPLIEVGAGFVPDFTGRENVYLNGSIMGMSRGEIDGKFDEIVAFAEMEEFIDTPVKRYSSGMQVKLAFAVATSVEAEILIVDEVLAVGDLAFQRKCFDRMESLIKQDGRTVLIVSHNIRQIERMCERVLLLDHGKIIMDGAARDVCNAFYEQNDRKIKEQSIGKQTRISKTGEVEVLDLFFSDASGHRTDTLSYGKSYDVVLQINASKTLHNPIFIYGVHTTDFVYITTTLSSDEIKASDVPAGEHEIRFRIDAIPLLPGVYSSRISIDVEDPIKNLFYGDNLLKFMVVSDDVQRTSPLCEGFFILNTHSHITSHSAIES